MRKLQTYSIEKREALLAAVSCLLALISCFAVSACGADDHRITLQLLMQCALGVLAVLTVLLLLRSPDERRYQILLYALLCAGIIMRIGYILYTPVTVRQHDIGALSADGSGHAAYIYSLMHGKLPTTNDFQFCHPPLFHALAAAVTTCYQALSGETDFAAALESAQAVSCCASILTLFFAVKLCREMKLSERATLLAVTLAAFVPNYYLLAGRVNNDALAVLFYTAAMYYTLCWYRGQSKGALCKQALCFGFGMMTKVTVATAALVSGCVMLAVLVRNIRLHCYRRTLVQYAVFGAIAFPLGLWYPVRNLLRFGQPLAYVFPISVSSELYCGNYSLWQRFGLSFTSLGLYGRPYDDYNVWQYLLKGSLFGEFSFDVGTIIPALLLLVNLFLILCSIAALVYVLICRCSVGRLTLAAFWLVQLGSYLVFNQRYPFGCSMDFRYVVPTAILGALFLAECRDMLPKTRLSGVLEAAVASGTALFAVLSVVMYCNI